MDILNEHKEALPSWSIAEAKQKLSELIRQAQKTPQVIYNRSNPVVVVLPYDRYGKLENISQENSLFNIFTEARKIASEEKYQLEVPVRKNRAFKKLG